MKQASTRTQNQLSGALVVEIINLIVYIHAGNVRCTDYFVASEEKICHMSHFLAGIVCYVSYPCPLLWIGGPNYCGFEGGFERFFRTNMGASMGD